MKVLGVHAGHDSCAALVVDGAVVADVQEERLSGIKHHAGLPFGAVGKCLELGGIEMGDLDAVAIARSMPQPELNMLFDFPAGREQRSSFQRRALTVLRRARGYIGSGKPIYIPGYRVHPSTQLFNIDHHLAHAASAFHTNPCDGRQLVVTADGMGDGVSLCLWRGEGGRLQPLQRWGTEASLGWFYGNVTEALGWIHGDGEGKTMGLAPYGDPEACGDRLDRFCPRFRDGELVAPHAFGQPFVFAEGGHDQYHFEEAREIRRLVDEHGCENVAAAAQRVLEREVFEIVFPWLEREKTDSLTCSGGIFLNVKLNQRLWETSKIARHHIFPNAGDSGLAVGAALEACHRLAPETPAMSLDSLYFGEAFSNDEIRAVLEGRKLRYREVPEPGDVAAEALAAGKIVGWFQGRMESGPRALGNRSILMSAAKAENKDILNARVKFREAFRPFCPSLLWERRDDYLEHSRDEFFMITSFTCRAEKRGRVPAVVHADATLRPQTVKRSFNPHFWELINRFGELTGEYLVLNTSFNLMGQPIVRHPRDAIRCFFDSGIDMLVMGDFVLEKEPPP